MAGALALQSRMLARLLKYGLELLEWEQLLVAQDHRCAICKFQFTRRAVIERSALVIDHEHSRAAPVRGLLCSRCNSGLGFFKDDPQRLRAAADYLECPPAKVILRAMRNPIRSKP